MSHNNSQPLTGDKIMSYIEEASLIETQDNIHCKVYANSHPTGFIIAKPKYIPDEILQFQGLKKRFIFGKCMTRFNVFTKKETVKANIDILKQKFPDYIYDCPKHKRWFLGVKEGKITQKHNSKTGVKELMKVPDSDLDSYLKATKELLIFLTQSGVSIDNVGISHSTLMGNYTPGISDIDILVYGKDNGWKVINFLEQTTHPKLKWKTEEDWAKYYTERVISKHLTKDEYIFNMVRKRDDGFFDNNVFSIFCVENPEETWYDWEADHEPINTVKIQATIKDAGNSIVRPGYYDITDSNIIEGNEQVPIKRIVTWSRPFVLQAKNNERIEACGLLEKVTTKDNTYYQIVIGYFDAYTTERGEQEYLKTLVN
jgi:uncharacterized protein